MFSYSATATGGRDRDANDMGCRVLPDVYVGDLTNTAEWAYDPTPSDRPQDGYCGYMAQHATACTGTCHASWPTAHATSARSPWGMVRCLPDSSTPTPPTPPPTDPTTPAVFVSQGFMRMQDSSVCSANSLCTKCEFGYNEGDQSTRVEKCTEEKVGTLRYLDLCGVT